jgi:hypothetical protein
MNEQLKREELRRQIESNPESIVGMMCHGFRYGDDNMFNSVGLNAYVGQVGEIIGVDKWTVRLKFKDKDGNDIYGKCYPLQLAIDYIVLGTEIELEEAKIKGEQGVNIGFDSKSSNDLKLESLKQEPKLYSILLTLGNVRMIYIDQTDEDVETHKKNNPSWHIIVIEQGQDKGIRIDLRY